MDYALKQILPSGIPAALQKADKYRELNQPSEAESICRDVLAIDPGNQLAHRILGLALTDQLEGSTGTRFSEAQQVFARLGDPYERAFYGGLACERQAKAQLAAGLPLGSIRSLFDQALAGPRSHPRGSSVTRLSSLRVASSAETDWPSWGWTTCGASSASGSSTKRRLCSSGCGILRERLSTISWLQKRMSRSMTREPQRLPFTRLRPMAFSIAFSFFRSSSAASSVSISITLLTNHVFASPSGSLS